MNVFISIGIIIILIVIIQNTSIDIKEEKKKLSNKELNQNLKFNGIGVLIGFVLIVIGMFQEGIFNEFYI